MSFCLYFLRGGESLGAKRGGWAGRRKGYARGVSRFHPTPAPKVSANHHRGFADQSSLFDKESDLDVATQRAPFRAQSVHEDPLHANLSETERPPLLDRIVAGVHMVSSYADGWPDRSLEGRRRNGRQKQEADNKVNHITKASRSDEDHGSNPTLALQLLGRPLARLKSPRN